MNHRRTIVVFTSIILSTLIITGCPLEPLVTITPERITISVGRIAVLKANSIIKTNEFIWSSSAPEVATVDSQGIVTGVAPGVATISVKEPVSGAYATSTVFVVPKRRSVLLWDGEKPFNYSFGNPSTENPFRGNICFEANPGVGQRARIELPKSSWRIDISEYDEVWLFIRMGEIGRSASMDIGGWPHISNRVDLSVHSAQGVLNTSWQLVRIPLSVLKTDAYDLSKVESFYFYKDGGSVNYKFCIDEIWAVSLDHLGADGGPLIGQLPGQDAGEIPVPGTNIVSLPITNVGSETLEVFFVEFAGDGASAYSCPFRNGTFTLNPGETRDVEVLFSPPEAGLFEAAVVLYHSLTAMGVTTWIPLRGIGIAPRLHIGWTEIDFGCVAVGCCVTRLLQIGNSGNADLVLTDINSHDGCFSVTADSYILRPGDMRQIGVTACPAQLGSQHGILNWFSNDPNAPQTRLRLTVQGLKPGYVGTLAVSVDCVRSSSVRLSWGVLNNTDEVRVLIGPEPPAKQEAPLPMQYEIARLPGTASGYTIENLAADVDVFMRVEALQKGKIIAQRNTHARTVGGPRATLDTPVRNVHMYAPNILQIVLADFRVHSFSETYDWYDGGINEVVGYTGDQWQEGLWTIRRADGSEIAVTAIYRNSMPVGDTYYEIGWAGNENIHLHDVDHHLFLVLSEAVGSPEVLEIQGPSFNYEILTENRQRVTRHASAYFRLPFSDRYLETPVIQVNQVGYSPAASMRYAYVSGWMGDGGPLSLNNFPTRADVVVVSDNAMKPRASLPLGLSISPRSHFDEDAGTEVREIDLASLPASEEAIYHVRVPGVGVSWPTRVSNKAVFESFYVVTRGMFHNRWAGDLRPEFTNWSRPQDHLTVFTADLLDNPWEMFPPDTPQTGERPLLGGHHDAGDFDIRIYHGIVAPLLMTAFETRPEVFTDGQLNIPESGNGIPDYLDEALWSVAGWEYLQETDGGVRHGAESHRHPYGVYLASDDPLPYWTYNRCPIHTARVAGIFAQASRLVKPYDAQRSEILRQRAISAYEYAINNGVDESVGGPVMYAASELFRLTGEEQYREMVHKTWEAHRPSWSALPKIYWRAIQWTTSFTSNTQPIMWDYLTGYLGSEYAEPTYVTAAWNNLATAPSQILQEIESRYAHRNARPAGWSPTWGMATCVGQFLFRIYAALQLYVLDPVEYQAAVDAISLSADYVLGCNPLGRTWITGLGSRPPITPRHADSLVFIKQGIGPMPGLAVPGPWEKLHTELRPYLRYGGRLAYPTYPEHPVLRRYADVHCFIACNESAIWQNQAPQAQLFAYLYLSSF